MKDNRDPKAVGFAVLNRVKYDRVGVLEAADGLDAFPIAHFKADESPLERYGDPRLYDVTVTTTVERTPIARLAAGPTR